MSVKVCVSTQEVSKCLELLAHLLEREKGRRSRGRRNILLHGLCVKDFFFPSLFSLYTKTAHWIQSNWKIIRILVFKRTFGKRSKKQEKMAKAALFHSAITPEIFLESWKGGDRRCVQPHSRKPRPEVLNHSAHKHLWRVCGFGTGFPDIKITAKGNICN